MSTRPEPARDKSYSPAPVPSRQPQKSRRTRKGKGGPPLRRWYQGLLSAAIVALSGIGIFHVQHPTLQQSYYLAGLFSVGLASLAWSLLPGKVTFKKAGVTAVGAIALFLAIL